ncbi:MAG: preprotein translocase subunit SecE [Rikenellaceae bacterium]
MINYIKDSYAELVNKVTWPSMSELQGSTIVVMVTTAIFAVIILAMDLSFEGIMGFIYKTLGNIF